MMTCTYVEQAPHCAPMKPAPIAWPAAAAAGALLSACGGGHSDSPAQAAAPAGQAASRSQALAVPERRAMAPYNATHVAQAFGPARAGLPDDVTAARFLAQASFGPTVATMAEVRTQGLRNWLVRQFNLPRSTFYFDQLRVTRNLLGGMYYDIPTFGPRNSELMINACWQAFITGADALRKRVVAALVEIFVITTRVGVIGIDQNQAAAAAFMDMLEDHAFGNFRDLLGGISTSTAMGVYLSFRDNLKAEYGPDGQEVRVPDENFSRELLQLFSIGLYELDLDGTPKRKRGAPIDSYHQADVFNLARVFTGLVVDGRPDDPDILAPWGRPMAARADRHSPEPKDFLGHHIAAGTGPVASQKRALDIIFRHPNVGPFIGRQLIQRLVTSNPSPAYVTRVAQAFNDNGQGVRGDMRAVISAVLLDHEARKASPIDKLAQVRGKVREPMMRLIAVARTMETGDPGTVVFPIANLSGATTGIGQAPLKSPSVFNFFRPGYAAPHSELGAQGHVAPEFQLVNGPLIAASVNKINEFVRKADDYVLTDISHLQDLAGDPAALVDRISLMLTGATLAEADHSAFVARIAGVASENVLLRVQAAIQLVASSPAFLVQRW